MKIPLGPCNIYLNGVSLGETLKEDDTSLEIKVKTEEVRTDESTDIKEIIELGKDITFKATLVFSQETLKTLGVDNNLSSLVKSGEIRIVPLNKSATILLFKTKITIEPFLSFKNNKNNKLKLKVQALKNNFDKKIEILFGVDIYNNLSARIRDKNLILFTKDGEKLPDLKIRKKDLIHSYSSNELSKFKIQDKHLIKILE